MPANPVQVSTFVERQERLSLEIDKLARGLEDAEERLRHAVAEGKVRGPAWGRRARDDNKARGSAVGGSLLLPAAAAALQVP
jgi:hypothetical protein